MDHSMERVRCAGLIGIAIRAIEEAAERAREAKALEVRTQLCDLTEELVYLHRQILELPPQKTPAACEFERAELHQDELPF